MILTEDGWCPNEDRGNYAEILDEVNAPESEEVEK